MTRLLNCGTCRGGIRGEQPQTCISDGYSFVGFRPKTPAADGGLASAGELKRGKLTGRPPRRMGAAPSPYHLEGSGETEPLTGTSCWRRDLLVLSASHQARADRQRIIGGPSSLLR